MSGSVEDSCEVKLNNVRLHFFYIVFILSISLIFAVTFHWTELKDFTNYLSVAATITSLVLGVLAIIYSFVSNGAMSQFLGSIGASTSSIRDVSVELRSIASGAEQIQQRADEKTVRLEELAESLQASILSLNERTNAIEGTVASLPTHLGELREAVLSRSSTSAAVAAPVGNNRTVAWTEETLTVFARKSSRLGVAVLRALDQAKARQRYTNLRKLFDTEQSKDFDYVYGFIVCSIACGVIEVEQFGEGLYINGLATLRVRSDALRDAIQNEWDRRAVSSEESEREFIASYDLSIPTSLEDAPEAKSSPPASTAQ